MIRTCHSQIHIRMLLFLAMFSVAGCAINSYELGFDSREEKKTELDHRVNYRRLVLMSRSCGDTVHVRYDESSEIRGATSSSNKMAWLSMKAKIGMDEAIRFSDGVYALASVTSSGDRDRGSSGYRSSIALTANGKEIERSFYLPPADQPERKLHDSITEFIESLDSDPDLEKSLEVVYTESDTKAAEHVDLRQLLRDPVRYSGKRLHLTAYLCYTSMGPHLSPSPATARSGYTNPGGRRSGFLPV